jgi:hypothetical protein
MLPLAKEKFQRSRYVCNRFGSLGRQRELSLAKQGSSMSNRKNAHRASAGEIPEYKLLKNQQPTKQNVALFEAAKR